jgi:hypothetical protein
MGAIKRWRDGESRERRERREREREREENIWPITTLILVRFVMKSLFEVFF